MREDMMGSKATRKWKGFVCAGATSLAAIALSGGCSLQDITVPNYDGPATTALSFVMTATPDVLTADGLSSAVVVVTLRGPDGRGVAGRDIVFSTRDASGSLATIGKLSAERATTGSDGRARIVFTAPPRTDIDTHTSVMVQGRVVGDDFAGYDWMSRVVEIEILPVDGRRYPPDTNPQGPVCSYVREPRFGVYYVGQPIRFQSTSYDPDGYIVRYEWAFADGTTALGADVVHTYQQEGDYYVRHVVVDNSGMYDSCNLLVQVAAAP
jgi:hypothetical protein